MATAPRSITCGICFKTIARPVTLPCHHSFCTSCVQQQLAQRNNNGVLCAVCGTLHSDIHSSDLGQLADKSLETYISGLSEGKFADPKCQWCEEAGATLQCAECMCTYCDGCCDAAHKRPTKRNHVISKLNDTYRSFYRRCHQYGHEEYRAEFFCEECDEVCCAYCLQVGPHKDHRSTNVARAATELRQQMTKDLLWLGQSKSKLEAQAGDLNRLSTTYADTYDTVEGRLTERFNNFKRQLAQYELDARKSLAQLRESGDLALTSARQQYLAQLNAVNEAVLRFKCLQSGGADYEVLESKAVLDACVKSELPTITGTGFSLVTAGELALSPVNIQLDLMSADMLAAARESETPSTEPYDDAVPRKGQRKARDARVGVSALTEYRGAVSGLNGTVQPLRLTFPVDEDVEATVRPDGVYLRCVARGGGGTQIGVRSKEMLEAVARAHPDDGGLVTWQVRLESVSDTFLGVVEKTSRAVVPEGFYWKPACAGIVDGHLGRQSSASKRLPVCANGDIIRFVYDVNTNTLRIVVNERKDCGVVLSDLHPKIAACFIFYPGEALTVLF